MNFIDKALEEITNGEDFVQAMADIYEHTEVREKLDKFPAWIRNIITVIDYDTELSMNGLDFKSYRNVIDALTDMGLIKEADILTAYECDYSQENADICYLKLALNNDYESFWNRVYYMLIKYKSTKYKFSGECKVKLSLKTKCNKIIW